MRRSPKANDVLHAIKYLLEGANTTLLTVHGACEIVVQSNIVPFIDFIRAPQH